MGSVSRYAGLVNLLTPQRIWCIRQNKPRHIVRDLAEWGVPEGVAHNILLARGVYKWLSVRRRLIKLKNTWKENIKYSHEMTRAAKRIQDKELQEFWRGYRKGMEECRADVRNLCHSERWQAQDDDAEAQRHLASLKVL